MKAKEYAQKLFELVEKQEEFESLLEKSLKEFCNDADKLIKIRRAKSDESVAACINEVNNKWIALVNHYRKLMNNEYGGWEDKMFPVLLEDGFKSAYVLTHPNRRWYFDINRHKKFIDDRKAEMETQNRRIASQEFTPYKVTPYEELTMDNLVSEIMCCLMALGNYANMGFPVQSIRPLALRITLLRYWKEKGEINLEDVKTMESYDDPAKFFIERGFSPA